MLPELFQFTYLFVLCDFYQFIIIFTFNLIFYAYIFMLNINIII